MTLQDLAVGAGADVPANGGAAARPSSWTTSEYWNAVAHLGWTTVDDRVVRDDEIFRACGTMPMPLFELADWMAEMSARTIERCPATAVWTESSRYALVALGSSLYEAAVADESMLLYVASQFQRIDLPLVFATLGHRPHPSLGGAVQPRASSSSAAKAAPKAPGKPRADAVAKPFRKAPRKAPQKAPGKAPRKAKVVRDGKGDAPSDDEAGA